MDACPTCSAAIDDDKSVNIVPVVVPLLRRRVVHGLGRHPALAAGVRAVVQRPTVGEISLVVPAAAPIDHRVIKVIITE